MKDAIIKSIIFLCCTTVALVFNAYESLSAAHCVSNSSELTTALTTATTNGEDDNIRVQQGTYNGNFLYFSTENYGITIEGGYSSNCTSRLLDATLTILNAQNSGSVLSLNCTGTTAEIEINTVTIQNGRTTNGNGGGIFVKTTGGVLTLTNSVIMNNTASGSGSVYGGGLYSEGMGSININASNITGNIVSGSQWCFGGGVGVQFSQNANLNDNIILDNQATRGGGGLFLHSIGNVELMGNKIAGNYVDNNAQGGAGIHLNTINTSTLINNVITENRTWGYGGGIHIFDLQVVNLTNNTISDNESRDGGGVWLFLRNDSASANFFNNIVWGNQDYGAALGRDIYIDNNGDDNAIISEVSLLNNDFDLTNGFYIKIDDTSVTYVNNIDNVDPLFVDAANDDYHLTADSPLIDVGNNSAPELPDKDKIGKPRIIDGNNDNVSYVDIGAYEYGSPRGDLDGDGDCDGKDLRIFAESYGMYVGP